MSKEDEPLHVMKTVFGYDSFREGQQQAIQAIVEGKDCVILMTTGGGKSFIFTIASIIKQGLTVIIEPQIFNGRAGCCSEGKRCVCLLL